MADKRTGKVTKQAPKASKPNTKAATSEKEQAKKSGNSRIRRTVMGTLSGVFMASAIIVAAIPVNRAQAVSVEDLSSFTTAYSVAPEQRNPQMIPAYGSDDPVFFDNSGMLGSAYVNRPNASDMVGVVAYYDKGSTSTSLNLVIPENMPAFQYDYKNRLIAVSGDTSGAAHAVGNNAGKMLCFVSQEEVTEDVEVSGNTVTNVISPEVLSPALASNMSEWQGKQLYECTLGPDPSNPDAEKITVTTPKVAADQLVVTNSYIGSTRYILENVGSSILVKYEPDESPSELNDYDRQLPPGSSGTNPEEAANFSPYYGVFQGAGNFSSVSIPKKIIAIGQNAFRETQLQSVSIGVDSDNSTASNLTCIGNNAFRDCRMLSSVTLNNQTLLTDIGDFAFAGCASLTSINIPDTVRRIGSGCFMDDTALITANLYGYSSNDGKTNLENLGDGVFYGCRNLSYIYLPNFLSNQSSMKYVFKNCENLTELGLTANEADTGAFAASNVTGCGNLLTVIVPSKTANLQCDESDPKDGSSPNCVFGKKNLGTTNAFPDRYTVNDEFAIKCYRNSPAYEYACEHEYSVGYLDNDPKYKDKYERVVNNYFFTVDENNQLVDFGKYKNGESRYVDIPERIGGRYISEIGSNTFSGNDEIEYIFIPDTVSKIDAGAFKDCIKLSEVEFDDAVACKEIGEEAFKTNAVDPAIQLRFTGTIAPNSAPFNFAMDPANNFNASSQPTKYISYTSQFPYNLEVELVVETVGVPGNQTITAIPTLVGAPDFDDFSTGNYSLSSYPDHVTKQNDIVRGAYTKYRANTISGNQLQYSEDEEKVIEAVFHPVLPKGIKTLNDNVFQDNDAIDSIVMSSVESIPDNAFKDCDNLTTVIMNPSGASDGEKIGDEAFADCPKLSSVALPDTLSELGHLPFHNDTKLDTVDFGLNPNFSCNEAIIKETNSDGVRLVECLPTRGNSVGVGKITKEELEDVNVIDDAAFMDCPGVTQVFFGNSPVGAIPDSCFENCTRLNYCEVSPLTNSIGDAAFRNTALSDIRIPAGVTFIAENAFTEDDPSGGYHDINGLNIQCEDGSTALTYAQRHGFGTAERIPHKWSVRFYDIDGVQIGETQLVEDGSDAVPPEPPVISGKKFVKWIPTYKEITSDTNIIPMYDTASDDPISGNGTSDKDKEFTVTFYDDNNVVLSIQKVKYGESAVTPNIVPEKDGYTFIGWAPEYDNVVSDLSIFPRYKSSGTNSDDPNNNGNNNNNSGPTPDNGNSNNSNTNNGTNPTNNSSSNTTNPTNTTQPTNNSTVNPTSQTDAKKTDTTANTNKTNTSTTTSKTASTTKANTSNGTKVQVNKSGISNPGLATATVAGSTDDFVVKITDSSDATSLVEQALYGEYGDLSNIRYMGFDISLYDSTGTTKIQNTDNLSVTVTMPIPDALKTYGGNNKAGAVSSSNTLEKLETRFTTINGVPCMSFVAKHFSPYTIYVDLNNLTASGYNDVTPKTADPIHPKWFLSIGLGIMSVLMFVLKGSKRKVIKVIS